MDPDKSPGRLVVVEAYRREEFIGRQLCGSSKELDEAVDRWGRHPGVRVYVDAVEQALPGPSRCSWGRPK